MLNKGEFKMMKFLMAVIAFLWFCLILIIFNHAHAEENIKITVGIGTEADDIVGTDPLGLFRISVPIKKNIYFEYSHYSSIPDGKPFYKHMSVMSPDLFFIVYEWRPFK